MNRLKVFIIGIFVIALAIGLSYGQLNVDTPVYLKYLIVFWLFSALYSQLDIVIRNGKVNMNYGISYGLTIALFAGPLGLLIFETIHRFTVYFSRKASKTADQDEFLHTFYNIGAFVINYSIAYYLFTLLYPSFSLIPFGFWILIILLVLVTSLLSDLYLTTIFFITGDVKTTHDAIEFIKSRSILDMGKTAFSNGLLYMFLLEERWEMLISLFILNFLVSRSFMEKSQSIQHKIERDKFEQMAYSDFMTSVYNRAYMDKMMKSLNESPEYIGIIVADIDRFKQYNDNYNHAVGDIIIQHFATTLNSYLDDNDLIFRSGGEEFTIFLRDKSYEETVELVEQMRVGVATSEVNVEYLSKTIPITYTASFGLYYFKSSESLSIEKGYVNADHLLLQSKKDGKNRISVKSGIKESSNIAE